MGRVASVLAEELYPATPKDGAEPLTFSAVPAAGRRAFLDSAVAFVHSRTRLSTISFEPRHSRSLAEVLRSEIATSTEKAELLKAQLDSAQIESRYAVVGKSPGELDPNLPDPWHFGHLILSVEPQPGIEDGILIDPSCEACAVGEMPQWTERASSSAFDAIVFWVDNGQRRTATMHATAHVEPSLDRFDWSLKLDGNGAATCDLTTDITGNEAMQALLVAPGPKHIPTVFPATRTGYSRVSVKLGPFTLDRHTSHLVMHGRLTEPSIVETSPDRIVVHLGLLADAPTSTKPKRPRVARVQFANDRTTRTQLTFDVPPGFIVESLPSPRERSVPNLRTSIEVEQHDDTVAIRRIVELRAGDSAPETYAAIEDALDATALDRESVVLRRR